MKSYLSPEYIVERDHDRCIRCEVCINQCTYETHYYDEEDDIVHFRTSQHVTHIVRSGKRNFYEVLRSKLSWSGEPHA